jgi:hypothetical protein
MVRQRTEEDHLGGTRERMMISAGGVPGMLAVVSVEVEALVMLEASEVLEVLEESLMVSMLGRFGLPRQRQSAGSLGDRV